MGHPSPTLSLSKIRFEISLGKRKYSQLSKARVNTCTFNTMAVGGRTLEFSSDFYSIYEVYKAVIRFKSVQERTFSKAFFEETGRQLAPDRVQMFLYLLHSYYPAENPVLIPPPIFSSSVFQDNAVDWDFSSPFKFPCSIQQLEAYFDSCQQKLYLEQELSQAYFVKTERSLSFANLDMVLGLRDTDCESLSHAESSPFPVSANPVEGGMAESDTIRVVASSDQHLPVMTAHEFAVSLKLFNLLSEGYPIVLSYLEMMLVFADIRQLMPLFPGIYPMMRWVSILSQMNFAKACPGWSDAIAHSIGKRKNACDNAYRKCTNIKVLKCCRDNHLKLTKIHKDLLSKLSVE